jgi:hypothetical protein
VAEKRYINIDTVFKYSPMSLGTDEWTLSKRLEAKGWEYVSTSPPGGGPLPPAQVLTFCRVDGPDFDEALAAAQRLVGALIVRISDAPEGT